MSFYMHLEKRRRGLLWETFRSEGEGSTGCKLGGEKSYALHLTIGVALK